MEPKLRVAGVSLSLGGRQILRDVCLDARPGEIVGLIGANGSGKSSLLNVISGYYVANSGSVDLDGRSVVGLSPSAVAARGIGRSFQSMSGVERLTVREYVQIGADRRVPGRRWLPSGFVPRRADERRARQRAEQLIGDAGLAELAARPIGACAHGMRKVADVLRVFAGDPEVVLLDEPTSGVGRQESARVQALCVAYAAERGGVVVVVDHDMRFISDSCRSVVALLSGRVVADGAPAEVFADPQVVASLLGTAETGRS